MRHLATALLLGSVLLAGAIAAPALYAEDQKPLSMMKMMRQTSEMMDHCNNMMSNSRPNEQWRKNSPSQREKRG
jgi:hypothetical protein